MCGSLCLQAKPLVVNIPAPRMQQTNVAPAAVPVAMSISYPKVGLCMSSEFVIERYTYVCVRYLPVERVGPMRTGGRLGRIMYQSE